MSYKVNQLKAIFFDLDNVLVFSERMHFAAWQQVMQQLGKNPDDLAFEKMIGIVDSRQSVIIQEQFAIPLTAHTIWEMKRKAFFELIPQGFISPAGRNAFLEKISRIYFTGVVSSSGVEVIEQILTAENIRSYFQFIIGHEDCENHKPHPLPYLMALEKAGCQPHEALIIEDSPAGIQAAKNANIPVIGILKDQTPEQLFQDVRYFDSFTQVNAWLEEQMPNETSHVA